MPITYPINITEVIPVRNDFFKRIETENYAGGDRQFSFELRILTYPIYGVVDITLNDGYRLWIQIDTLDTLSADFFILQNTIDVTFENVFQALLQFAEINNRFHLYYKDDGTIVFTEKEYTNHFIFDDTTGGNIFTDNYVSGNLGTPPSGYTFNLELNKISNGVTQTIYKGNYVPKKGATPLDAAYVDVNLSSLIRNTIGVFIPGVMPFSSALASDNWGYYNLRIIENPYPTLAAQMLYSNDFAAYNSGLSNKNDNNLQQRFLGSVEHLDYYRAMHLGRNKKRTRLNMPEYLYCWIKDLYVNLFSHIKMNVEFFDSTGIITDYNYDSPAYTKDDLVICFATGTYNAIGINTVISLSPVEYYVVKLIDSYTTNVIYEQTYYIDRAYRPNARMFEYINSLGVMCSFFTTGEIAYGVKISFDEAAKELNKNFTQAVFESFEYNTIIAEEFTINTGWIENKFEAEGMLEFFASEYKYIFSTDQNYTRYAIIVDKKEIDVWKSNDGKYQFEFKYKYSQVSRVFTPIIAVL